MKMGVERDNDGRVIFDTERSTKERGLFLAQALTTMFNEQNLPPSVVVVAVEKLYKDLVKGGDEDDYDGKDCGALGALHGNALEDN